MTSRDWDQHYEDGFLPWDTDEPDPNLVAAVERPTEHDIEHAEEHFADFEGHPLSLGEEFQGVSETGVPKSH